MDFLQAYIGLAWMVMIVFCYGYTSFGKLHTSVNRPCKPDRPLTVLAAPWSVSDFFIYYTMVLLAPILFIFWKVVKRTKFVRPHEADLVWERPTIDAYEDSIVDPPLGFWTELVPAPLRCWGPRKNKQSDRRASRLS